MREIVEAISISNGSVISAYEKAISKKGVVFSHNWSQTQSCVHFVGVFRFADPHSSDFCQILSFAYELIQQFNSYLVIFAFCWPRSAPTRFVHWLIKLLYTYVWWVEYSVLHLRDDSKMSLRNNDRLFCETRSHSTHVPLPWNAPCRLNSQRRTEQSPSLPHLSHALRSCYEGKKFKITCTLCLTSFICWIRGM